MRHLHTSGTQTTIRLDLYRLNCLWLDFYRIVIQYITPPQQISGKQTFSLIKQLLIWDGCLWADNCVPYSRPTGTGLHDEIYI